MDTSETYIKMSDTPEIQSQIEYYRERPKFPLNSFWMCYAGIASGLCMWLRDGDGNAKYIWLPTQSQLQEMVEHHVAKAWFGAQAVCLVTRKQEDIDKWMSMSFEQLWLGFVMKEKYNKVWNGEAWLKQDSVK